MEKKKVFISGLNGMDSSHLIDYLISNHNVEIYGTIRRHGTPETQDNRIKHISHLVHSEYGEVGDSHCINHLIKTIEPDYIFHLAAQSHVGISFSLKEYTLTTNTIGTLNMLEAMRVHAPNARLYFAASSEIFGDSVDQDGFQRLDSTPRTPCSIYGISKLAAFNMVKHYRKAYDLFCVSGILFNHTSERRGKNFIEKKIVSHGVEILNGLRDSLVIGRDDIYRDWGSSKDYVRAMWLMVNYGYARDWLIATGEAHSIKEVYTYVFEKLGLDPKKYVVHDEKFIRKEELEYLRGDSEESKKLLKWEPEYSLHEILDEMIEHELSLYKEQNKEVEYGPLEQKNVT